MTTKNTIHICLHEEELGKMTAILDKVSNEVYGNGQEGLSKTIPRLEQEVHNLVNTTAAHTNAIANLVSFQATHNGEEIGKKQTLEEKTIADNLARQKRQDMYWKLATIATIILTAIGLYLGIK